MGWRWGCSQVRLLPKSLVPRSLRRRAKDQGEARERWRHFVEKSLRCVEPDIHLRVGPSPRGSEGLNSLFQAGEPGAPIHLTTKSGSPLYLSFEQSGEVVPDPRFRREYKISTRSYAYALRYPEPTSEPLIQWHWHPGLSPDWPEPHIHVSIPDPLAKGTKLHIPTGSRVTIEQVLSFLIRDWEVVPTDDWREVIAETQLRFDTFQTQDQRRQPE